ncbi:MAG: hypothetical protein U0270_15665 [Labilithrix sp.]
MKRVFFAAAGLMAGSLWFAPACSSGLGIDLSTLPEGGLEGGTLPDGQLPTGPGGVGAACSDTQPCRPGLTCGSDAKCAPSGATAIGGDCQISAECNNGYCGADRKCAAAGTGEANAACTADADCKARLRCNLAGLSGGQCQPEGNVDLFGACQVSSECFGGLLCLPNPQAGGASQCLPTQAGVIGIPKAFEVPCEAETGDVQSYFDVPRGTPLKDFFRLPFPNDIRTIGSSPNLKPDYKDFPVPGAGVLGFDAVDRWARFIEKTGTGWSSYSSITFRFSGELDFASFDAQFKVTHLVDLTDKSELGHAWSSISNRTSYVCPNSLTFRPQVGHPFKPGHSYAAYITTGAKAKSGVAVKRGADFAAMVAASDPGGDLSTPWNKYKPLREYLTAQAISPDTILNAAVFTVGQVDKPGRDMGNFVEAATAPNAWTKCEAGTTSPCAQHDGKRNCPATPAAGVDEYHTVLKLPLYQKGNLPFMKPEDDGSFVPGTKQSTIDVCAAITIPSGATGEIPVLVYGHGTGGSFRSHANENVASRMAALKVAVLGIDQVGHGTRRGTETADPSGIFFNFANPAAAHGNVLQGGADQVALVKFAQTGPTVGGVTLSKTKIAYWGHSQGATEGAISMPYTKGVTGVLFSGEGGSLIDSLLTKTSPQNLLALAPFIISEPKANVDSSHPVLTLFQNGIDPADPMNHAANMNPVPPVASDIVQKHVFVPYGQKDTYATPSTQLVYLTASNLFVAPTPSGVTPDKLHRDPQAGPVSANSAGFTAVTRQYAKPADDDGHFVIFRDPSAIADGDKFLKAVLVDGTAPSIP